MPRSKHRPGGQIVAHPGRGKPTELPLSPEDVLWQRFTDGYSRPFHEKYGDSAAADDNKGHGAAPRQCRSRR
jgi:hypothetical protein